MFQMQHKPHTEFQCGYSLKTLLKLKSFIFMRLYVKLKERSQYGYALLHFIVTCNNALLKKEKAPHERGAISQ